MFVSTELTIRRWNSAIFVTNHETNLSYYGFLVSKEFLEQPTVDCTQEVAIWPMAQVNILGTLENWPPITNATMGTVSESPMTYCSAAQDLLDLSHAQGLVKMGKSDCIANFVDPKSEGYLLPSPRQNDFLAVTRESQNTAVLEAWFVNSYAWLCISSMEPELNGTNSTSDYFEDCLHSVGSLNASDTFEVGLGNVSVDYCLVTPPRKLESELQCSLMIIQVVIFCNTAKFICCLLAARRMAARQPMVTIGDAVASFLEKPDPTTARQCLCDKNSAAVESSLSAESRPPIWNKRVIRYRWYQAPEPWRWYATITLYVIPRIHPFALTHKRFLLECPHGMWTSY